MGRVSHAERRPTGRFECLEEEHTAHTVPGFSPRSALGSGYVRVQREGETGAVIPERFEQAEENWWAIQGSNL